MHHDSKALKDSAISDEFLVEFIIGLSSLVYHSGIFLVKIALGFRVLWFCLSKKGRVASVEVFAVFEMARRPPMHLLRLRGFPILQQLQLEERLLRTTAHNWCLINEGTSPPAIVMGISGKPEQLLDVKAVIRDGVPVIRRFSGGGTVIVDDGTVFVTLICRGDAVPVPKLYPRPIMDWTEELYVPAFRSVPGFQLREHDYVFYDKKFGGNAQSITKGRFLHHTSFLWDFQDSRMAYLSHPSRAPAYRLARQHSDFICRLKDHIPSREVFVDSVVHAFEQQFSLEETDLERIEQTQPLVPHLNGTYVLSTRQLEDSLKVLQQKQ